MNPINIKDYLKYYIGCDVIVDGEHRGKFIGADLVPNSVDQIYYTIEIDGEDEDSLNVPYNDDSSEDCRLQPILRRIESLTEAEMRDLYFHHWPAMAEFKCTVKFHHDEVLKHLRHGQGIGFSSFKEDGTHMATGTLSFVNLNAAQFHYLLSLGIDLWGLIDAGLALDAATFNKEK